MIRHITSRAGIFSDHAPGADAEQRAGGLAEELEPLLGDPTDINDPQDRGVDR